DDRVAVRTALEHPEVRLAMAHVAVELDERAWVAQLLGTLAGEQLAGVLVSRDRALGAGMACLVAQLREPLQLLGRGVVVRHAATLVHSYDMDTHEVKELRVALTVDDFDRALAFYRDVLGLPMRDMWVSPGSKGAILEIPTATLELFDEGQAAMVD